MELTRRHVLAGAAGVAAAPLLPAISANAAAPMAGKQAAVLLSLQGRRHRRWTVVPTAANRGCRLPMPSWSTSRRKRSTPRWWRPSCRRTSSTAVQSAPDQHRRQVSVVIDTGKGRGRATSSATPPPASYHPNLRPPEPSDRSALWCSRISTATTSTACSTRTEGSPSRTPRSWSPPTNIRSRWMTAT